MNIDRELKKLRRNFFNRRQRKRHARIHSREEKIAQAEQAEMEKAVGYWVRTGDPTLINELSKARSDAARYREVWD